MASLLTILLAALGKSSSNMRYTVSCMALGLIVLLPVVTIQLVPVSVPERPAISQPVPAQVVVPIEPVSELPALEAPTVEPPAMVENADASPAPAVPWRQRISEKLEPALPHVVSVWLIGVFALSIWHLGGWTQLQRLRRKMVKPVDESLHAKLSELAQKLGVRRAVALTESALVRIPTVVGWLRPAILLPASALTGLTAEQLGAILAHELAHVRRHDYLVNMLQTIVETLGFYHPAVWWISRKIRVERENCCDDLAVGVSDDRIGYARALTSMEQIRSGRGELAVAAAGGNLLKRIHRLVAKDTTDSSRASWMPSAVTILLIAIIAMPATLALTTHGKTPPSAQFLLDKMLEHRSRVKNLQYVAENHMWRDVEAEQDKLEEQLKRMRERGSSERSIERLRTTLSKVPASRYQILKCTTDDAERVKIEQTGGTYDSSGKKVPSDDIRIWAWNGVQATTLSQRSEFPGSARIEDTPGVATKLWHPWRSSTGIFCKDLEETIAAGKPVSVEQRKDGAYRVAFDYKTSRYVAIVDPSKGYTCTLRERYDKQGQLTSRNTATYEEVVEGIWFPISGQREEYTANGSVSSKSTFQSSHIRINDPAFNASYFNVDMPEGTSVRDEVQGKHYVVGSKRVYDLDDPQKSSTETEKVDPNGWEETFYSIYRLEDGQVLKRIAPPFIPERREYFKLAQPGRYSANTPYHLAKQYVFKWDGDLKISNMDMGGGIPRLSTILRTVFGLGITDYDIPAEHFNMDMSGDWIKRTDTPQEVLLQALEQIIKEETGKDIHFVKQKVETEAIVARGTYRLTPLHNAKEKDCVHVFTDRMDTYQGAGGGSGTLSKFLRFIANHRIRKNIIDRTASGEVRMSWRNHYSSDISWLEQYKQQHDEKVDMLLNNLTRQTGLTFEKATAPVEKWCVAEQATPAEDEPAEGPKQAETRAGGVQILPAAIDRIEDKAHIMVECRALEIYPSMELDREAIIAAENLLGKTVVTGRSTSPGTLAPTVEEFIREVTGATVSAEEPSSVTGDAQRTQKMVDLLASRGSIRILMNPTVEVVDGGKARVSSSQKVPIGKITAPSTQSDRHVDVTDYLEITPHILDGNRIKLLAEGTIHRHLPRRDKEQPPAIMSSSFSTEAVVKPGMSLVVGGMKETQAGAKDPEEPQTELLFILTPTIVETTKPRDETGVVSTATTKALPRNMVTRVYHIADLIGDPANHGGMSRAMKVHNLVQLIQKRVEPESWYDLSDTGEGTITPYP
ncbi:MAG: M48 family metalloprotease, partial [Phycisphaerales bacterium]